MRAQLPQKPPPHTQQPLFKNTQNYLETDSFTEGVDCIVDNLEQGLDDDDNVYKMFTLPLDKVDPIKIAVEIDSTSLLMKLDTGASLSIISENVYKMLLSRPLLQSTSARLRTYTGEAIKVLGSVSVTV